MKKKHLLFFPLARVSTSEYNTPTNNFAYLSKVPNEKRKFALIPTNVHTLKTDLVTIPIRTQLVGWRR